MPLRRMARRIMIACALIYQAYCMGRSRAPILWMSCLLSLLLTGMFSYRPPLSPPSAHAEVAAVRALGPEGCTWPSSQGRLIERAMIGTRSRSWTPRYLAFGPFAAVSSKAYVIWVSQSQLSSCTQMLYGDVRDRLRGAERANAAK
jgi:hypothetical protein